jgi:chromosome segregation ATPase
MDNNLLLQIIAAIVYVTSVYYMDSRYTQCCNEMNDELREVREINRDLEEQIAKQDNQIEGHKFFVESAEKREQDREEEIITLKKVQWNLNEQAIQSEKEIIELMREKKNLLEQLLERGDIIRNLETIITDRQTELEALNKKVANIAKTATNLVEEAETPHLVEA